MKKALSLALVICLLCTAFCMPASAATFTDVPDGAWYAKAVNFCADNSYMTGIGGGKFDPGGNVTRAQMAQILYNFSGKPDVSKMENPFTDVGNEWFRAAVIFVKSVGVVSGTSATTYTPNKDITREEVCVMLMNYYTKSTKSTPTIDQEVINSFTDKNSVSSWARNAISWAISNKIMSGTGNNKLDPKGTCTRAQLAQFIMNYFNAFGKIPPIELPDEPDPILPDIPGFPEDGHFEPIPEDWLPVGGYWQGDRKYNMYGIDITDVDGVPMADEIHIMEMINNYRVQNGLPELKWSKAAQVWSEIRAREAGYIYNQMHSSNPTNNYTTPHARPDGSSIYSQDYTEGNIGSQYLQTNNFACLEENKMNELMIDPDRAVEPKVINQKSIWTPAIAENLGQFHGSQMLASRVFNGWAGSPGHDGALKANFKGYNTNFENGYFAVGMYVDTAYTFSYNAFSLEWIQPTEIDPSDPTEWYPGKGVNYDQLGFTIDDIPDEYSHNKIRAYAT